MSSSRRPRHSRPAQHGQRPRPTRPVAQKPTLLTGGSLAALIVVATFWWLHHTARFDLSVSGDRNVVLVTIDTLRADALSSYGGPAQTPHLDALAAHGARFTFAHAHAVVTLPSHTTILTGHLPYEHGIRDNSGFRVRAGTETLATRLKRLGFATGAFVGGFPVTKRFGLTPGFDVYDDQMPEMRGAIEASMPERRADVVVGRALAWIANQHGRFFGWVHVYDPHSPYRPPDEFASQYASQPYYGEVAFVDKALGPLFAKLESLDRPTLLVVTADHGESLGEHGEATHGMFAYESTLHVPLIISEVGAHAPSRNATVVDASVRHVDLVPTILEALGAPAADSLAGTSLRAVIHAGYQGDRPVYFEAMTYNLVRGWAPLRGVLSGHDKYIDLPIPELYDLTADPREAHNAATASADRAAVLLNLLRGFNVAPPNRPGQESADAAAALRSLGYVTGTTPARAAYTEADDPKRLVAIDRDLHTATDRAEEGDRRGAIKLLESVVRRRPDTGDAYITLAHAYWEAGDPEEAIATLERALSSGAPTRDVKLRLGLYLAESHSNSARAITVLSELSADDVEALNGLGVAYGDAGRYADAERTFRRVLALDPTNGIAYQNLASMELRQALDAGPPAVRQDKLRQAEALARQSLAADPGLADACTTLGVILSSSGRKAEAIDSWKRAVDLDGSQFNALYNLWFELAAAGRQEEATVYARRFVANAPPAFFARDIDEVRSYLQRDSSIKSR